MAKIGIYTQLQLTTTLIVLLLLTACNQNKVADNRSESRSIKAAVFLSAGENYPIFNESGLPTFFNIARILSESGQEMPTLILSDRLNKGAKVDLIPLASFSFNRDTTEYKYIVSTIDGSPLAKEDESGHEFLINHVNIQNSLEMWFRSQCPDWTCKEFHWHNKYATLMSLQTKTGKN